MQKALILAVSVLILAASCASDDTLGDPGISGSAAPDESGVAADDSGADDGRDTGDTEGTDGTGDTGTDGSDGTDTTGDAGTDGTDGTDGSDVTDPVVELEGSDVVLTAGLARFGDCDALLDYLHTEYSARVGPWGFSGDNWFGPMPIFAEVAEEGAVDADGSAAVAPVEGLDFSGTNVQEAGVDEADIVKTDGRRIFTLSSGRLVVVDAAARTLTGSVEVADGWGRELFIDGDNLLVIAQSFSDAGAGSQTVLQRIDVSDSSPEVVQTLSVQGDYVSARSVDGTARVILRFDPQWNFPFVYPQSEAGEDTAEEANRAAVLASTLDDWLPHYATGGADSSTGSLLVPCSNVYAPSVFSGFGITTVMSMPLGDTVDPSKSTAVTAPGDTVYASTGSLYVATTRWIDDDEFGSDDDWDEDAWLEEWRQRRTSVHRFDISGETADYAASGEVLGVIHNQFSLSEHAGHLRVVTTVGGPWGEDSDSQVRVLSTAGNELVEVGSVGDIGRGEQVQSVRFVGDIGYVVTFRQIDPFYTIDLSDPANPTILGELKIPGFSSYLHPISDTMVLGVGSDADDDGRITGSKVSLFDVSDLAAPREVAVWTAPDGWNDVGWDHRAFLWWAPENLAVIPVTVWNDWSGAIVLRVADGAIAEVGRVDHIVDGEAPGQTDCRRLTEADLPSSDMDDFSTELEYYVSDGYMAVLACEPGEAGMTGFECPVDPWMDILTDEGQSMGLLDGEESISICWPIDQPDMIVRSIVIDEELWTLGFKGWGYFDGSTKARLHVNDLQTLERLAALEL